MGMVCAYTSVVMNRTCNLKYAEHIWYASQLFYGACDRLDSPFFSRKPDYLTVAGLVRPRDGSEWVWDCTVVIQDHDLTR